MRFFKYFIYLLLLLCYCFAIDYEDNEFAEFEDVAIDELTLNDNPLKETPKIMDNLENNDEELVVIDEDDSEFEHFQDIEEFEGFETKEENSSIEPKITITAVPMHFRDNWDSYWLEMLMISGLIVYFINFIMGKNKNQKIANIWLQHHKGLLEDNFSLVGDDASLEKPEGPIGFIKDSENVFTLWCSGRTCCEGMLVELKLIKRQDLVAILAQMMRPTLDQLQIKITMNREDMDTFIFCVAHKKTAIHLSKEMADLSVYCPERKLGEKLGLPSQFNVMGEIPEATSAMLDSKIVAIINKYPNLIDYIHFSDQYSGVKLTEEQQTPPTKLPEIRKMLCFNFNLVLKGKTLDEAVEQLKPLMLMVFYSIEKVKRYRLSKEAKNKADKNRQKVEEAYLKSTHQARAEAAAARREEKRRLEKEKMLADEDPEKQRRWEEKEQKRQAKKKAPKMKQLKVKAL